MTYAVFQNLKGDAHVETDLHERFSGGVIAYLIGFLDTKGDGKTLDVACRVILECGIRAGRMKIEMSGLWVHPSVDDWVSFWRDGK